MRRGRAGLRGSSMTSLPEGEQGFWPSYADMMSSFALILFFLMLLAYIQNIITGNNLLSTQDQLALTEKELALTVGKVEDAEKQLGIVNADLDDANAALLVQQQQMAEYSATIAGQVQAIDEQTKLIEAQDQYIALTNEELVKLRKQMQTIALLRLSILKQIEESLSATLSDTTKVRIGDNGSIILSEGLLFDYNSSTVKKESYAMLNKLTDAFKTFLDDPNNARYVDTIVIAGHTDDRGSDTRNRELSAERANAVLNYLFTQNDGRLAPYASYFCAAGYGATRPVASNDTDAGRSANRRIEISIILKDETVLEIVDAYLAEEIPSAGAMPAPAETPKPQGGILPTTTKNP